MVLFVSSSCPWCHSGCSIFNELTLIPLLLLLRLPSTCRARAASHGNGSEQNFQRKCWSKWSCTLNGQDLDTVCDVGRFLKFLSLKLRMFSAADEVNRLLHSSDWMKWWHELAVDWLKRSRNTKHLRQKKLFNFSLFSETNRNNRMSMLLAYIREEIPQ